MNKTPNTVSPAEPARPGSPGAAIASVLGSLKFALIVIVLVALACVAGTLLPQGDEVARYLHHNPAAKGRMQLFDTLGLTHVFFSAWFLGLLGVLYASLTVCTYRRICAIRTAPPHRRLRVIGSVVTHISLLIILAGALVRGAWGEKGSIAFREGETVTQFRGQKGPAPLPFAVRLVKFEIELNKKKEPDPAALAATEQLFIAWRAQGITKSLPVATNVEHVLSTDGSAATATGTNAYRIVITRYVPDFVIDNTSHSVVSRSVQPNNPAIEVEVRSAAQTNVHWLFAKFPDFHMHGDTGAGNLPFEMRFVSMRPPTGAGMGDIKDFKSTLQILEGDQVVREKTIEVNAPLSYGGYTLYQSGYDPRDMKWTSLQVVKDPGVPLVYTGFTLMMVGLVIVFWIQPSIGPPKKPGEAA